MFNHQVEGVEKPVGHYTDAICLEKRPNDGKWQKVWDETAEELKVPEGIPGMYYEADINPNGEYADSITRGDVRKVSIQVVPAKQDSEVDEETGERYTRAYIKDYVEASVVPAPGFMETNMAVMCESFSIHKKAEAYTPAVGDRVRTIYGKGVIKSVENGVFNVKLDDDKLVVVKAVTKESMKEAKMHSWDDINNKLTKAGWGTSWISTLRSKLPAGKTQFTWDEINEACMKLNYSAVKIADVMQAINKESMKESGSDQTVIVNGKKVLLHLSGSGTQGIDDDGVDYAYVNGKWYADKESLFEQISEDDAKEIMGEPAIEELSTKTKVFTYDDLISEHEKLVAALQSGDPEKIKAEAEEQAKELAQYKQEAGVSKEMGMSTGNVVTTVKLAGRDTKEFFNVLNEISESEAIEVLNTLKN
jgi:hypothetical protein